MAKIYLTGMEKVTRAGRIFYSIALIVYGIQQFIYSDFRPVFFPAWQSKLPLLAVWAWLFGIGLIVAALAIILEKKSREASLTTGIVLLFLFCFVHIPYEIISDPYYRHFAMWTNPLKELALSGGAFLIAGTFKKEEVNNSSKPAIILFLEKIIPFGKIFFSITMISFGIMHFMYIDGVSKLVPAWFPDPAFWTYFGAVALIASGIAIILNIRMKQIAILLSIMLFLWVFVLHLPRAIATPYAERGNELASMFDALAFCGIALIIAFGLRVNKDELS